MDDYIKYTSAHSGKHKDKHHMIIVGAGIVGVCIAYYLTRHPSFDPEKYHITIIESKRVAGGASGKAGGLLALWAFPQQIVPLSYQLHKELAEEHGGNEIWDYRGLTTVSLEGDIQSALQEDDESEDEEEVEVHQRLYESEESDDDNASKSSEDSDIINNHKQDITSHNSDFDGISPQNTGDSNDKKSKGVSKNSILQNNSNNETNGGISLPPSLNWINKSSISGWSILGGKDTTAQVHPYKFTNFMLKKAIESGGVELIIGKVEELIFGEEGEVEGIVYSPSAAKDEQNGNNDDSIELYSDKVILSMGPWTSRILPDCPISGLRAHSITILPENEKMVSPFAIFTELKISRNGFVSPELYARKDEVYVCGEGDTAIDVPESTDDVEVIKEKCDTLFKFVGKLSPALKNGKILKRQACYLPVLDVPSSSGPLIGETNVPRLYLASGHSCWGINNAPGTGKLMAELLMDGDIKSADISALDPSLYFDASIWE